MKLLLFFISTFFLFGCGNDETAADAFGNFETKELYIAAEVPGRLLTLTRSEGEQIPEGAIIATIDSTQLYLKKRQLQATVQALRSRLQNVPVQLDVYYERLRNLEREIKRMKALVEDSAATPKQLDDLTGEMQVVRSQIAASESQLSTANQGILAEIRPLEWQIAQVDDQLDKTTITAPISATILETFKEPGELVSVGQPLVKVADLERMILRGYISGDQLSSVSLGQMVEVRVDAEDGILKSYPASVAWISSKAEFTPKIIQTRNERVNLVYAVKFRVKNDGYLKIGMPGEVLFSPEASRK